MEYLKLDPDIDSNPEVMRAGWCGARFFELMLKISAKKDLRGRITPGYQDLQWLARIWNLEPTDLGDAVPIAAFMARAKDAAFRAGLMTQEGEDWVLRGWEKFYSPPLTSTQRSRVRRSRTDATNATNATLLQRAPLHATDATNATLRHSTTQHGTPPTTQKQEAQPPQLGGPAFFARVQQERRTHGLTTESPPHPNKLGNFYSEAMLELSGDESRLWAAYEHYAEDDYWAKQSPQWPFRGFIAQWRDHVPRKATG